MCVRKMRVCMGEARVWVYERGACVCVERGVCVYERDVCVHEVCVCVCVCMRGAHGNNTARQIRL